MGSGIAGVVAGSIVGDLSGAILAPCTFGLSMLVCWAMSGCIDLVGVTAGSSAGLGGGMAVTLDTPILSMAVRLLAQMCAIQQGLARTWMQN